METRSWSQMAGNKAALPLVLPEPVPGTSRSINCENTMSLNDIMSEQLIVELQNADEIQTQLAALEILGDDKEDIKEYKEQFLREAGLLDVELEQSTTRVDACNNDEALARMLQREYDLEHDRRLFAEEKNYNKNSKVKISLKNQRLIKDGDLEYFDLINDEEPIHEYGEDSEHWDFFEEKQKNSVKVGSKGFHISADGEVTTKHDLEANKCRNACKVMEFESDINTGDGGCFPMKLSNSVYNTLKLHSISEGKRSARLHEKKEKSTAEKAMDEKSRIILFKLLDRDMLESINGVIATGKESVVIHGVGSNLEKGIPKCEIAIKVFKTSINEFVNRIEYMVGDPILEQARKLSKQNPKLTIPLWAEKEMHNLNRMRKFGVSCPQVLHLKKNILIMTFVGRDGRPAPTLKSLIYSNEKLFSQVYEETIKMMVKLYKDCDLIHADLSEYNLLWFENKLWCIDVSQAVRNTHPMAFRFLWRDCVNITKFFSKKTHFDSTSIMSAEELFTLVSGKVIPDVDDNPNIIEILDKLGNYERNDEKLAWRNQAEGIDAQNDCFDELFAQSVHERSQNISTSSEKPIPSLSHSSPKGSRKYGKNQKKKESNLQNREIKSCDKTEPER